MSSLDSVVLKKITLVVSRINMFGVAALLSRVKHLSREHKLQPCLAKHILDPTKLHQQDRFFPRMYKSKDLGLYNNCN